MSKKTNIFEMFLGILKGTTKSNPELEKSLSEGYSSYLDKPKEYHDQVIKRMYRNTKYADESPEALREILRLQCSSKTGLSQ